MRDSGEIRLRLSQAEDAWLVLTPDPGYPIGQPLRVAVSGDFPVCTKKALEAAGQAVALDYALANEVAAHATFSAVREALRATAPDAAGMTVDRSNDTVEGDMSLPSSPNIGVSLRWLLRFCEENRVGGFGKFDTDGETTGDVCRRVVVPATQEQRCTYASLPTRLGECGLHFDMLPYATSKPLMHEQPAHIRSGPHNL